MSIAAFRYQLFFELSVLLPVLLLFELLLLLFAPVLVLLVLEDALLPPWLVLFSASGLFFPAAPRLAGASSGSCL